VAREIADPNTGNRWVLLRDDGHPGGPGRLMLAGISTNADGNNQPGQSRKPDSRPVSASAPVIRAGDRLIVEEYSAIVEARLEAQALGTAAPGSAFRARLAIGGKVVRVVALGPGRAALAPQMGMRP
jgi:hypothetical protein